MECAICIEKFNKNTHKKIQCLYCQHEVCHKCVEKYLIENTIIPQCMNCKKEWNMEFLRGCLSRNFMDKQYKEHQKGAITAEAEALLGQYQDHAQHQIETEKLRETLAEAKRRYDEAQRYYQQCQDNINAHLARRVGNTIQERREFFMACPSHDCRGKLSTAYKCGMCEHFFCPDCHKDKGPDRNTDHECLQDDLDTVKLLRDNTRPCPKCHMGIYKTQGCDQMWCVQCHTCFSWASGRILHGVVHNPHYYEHQRRMGNGVAPRVPGDIPCGGMPTHQQMINRKNSSARETMNDVLWLTDLHRYINEMTYMTMPSVYRKFNDREACQREYGIQYLRNKITRVKWIDALYKIVRQEEKYRRYYQVLETLSVGVAEQLRDYVHGEKPDVIRRSCEELFKYANEECDKMKKQYKMSIPTLKVDQRINHH